MLFTALVLVLLVCPWASPSVKKGPVVPRFRFLPVRFGSVTFSRRLLVVTGVESRRLANGSSGRSDTEIIFLSSSSFSLMVGVSNLDLKPYTGC